MTNKDLENRFIAKCKQDFRGNLTFEAEMLLRYGYAQGAKELGNLAYAEGVDMQRAAVLNALGAVSRKHAEDDAP